LDANFLRLLNQLHPRGEGEEGDEGEEGEMEELIQRLMARVGHGPPQPSNEPLSPQDVLNEQMYQAARKGDLAELQKAVQSGTKVCSGKGGGSGREV
jgi:hypothetical protein